MNDRRATGLGGVPWEPAITDQPQIGIQRFNGDFTQNIEPAAVQFGFNLGIARTRFPVVASALWAGAPVEIRLGKVGDPWGKWPIVFRGLVGDFPGDYPRINLTAAVDTEPFLADVLSKTYAGTGGIEGGPDLKNRLKPLAIGRPRNVEPVLVDAVNNVHQFTGYGPMEGVETLYERASAFPPPIADYATYGELVAANIPNGRWATCRVQGLIRLGAPAAGVITGDIRGHAVGGTAPRAAGALARLVAQLSGVADDRIDTVALDRLDDEGATFTDAWVTEQVSVIDLVRRLVLPCNWHPLINNLGVLTAAKPNLAAAPSFTLHAQGKALPPVLSTAEQSVSPPYAKTIMAAERNWRVQTFDEIAFEAPLVDRGNYDQETVYREGNFVTLTDGSQWLYVNLTPSKGHAPPIGTSGDDWWSNMRVATTATDIKYGDGSTLEDMKPADPGATYGAPGDSPVGDSTGDEVSARVKAAHDAIFGVDDLTQGILARLADMPEDATIGEFIKTLAVAADVGGNLLSSSDFASGTGGWYLYESIPDKHSWGVDTGEFSLPGERYLGLIALEPNGGSKGALYSDWVSVTPGEWWQASAWIAARHCVNRLVIEWGDADGNVITPSAAVSEWVDDAHPGGDDLASFSRVWCKAPVPSEARAIRLAMDKGPYLANPDGVLSAGFLLRPMLCRATEEQTLPSPYRPVGGGKGLELAQAYIQTVEQVAAGANLAAAQRIGTLEANVGGPDGITARLTTTEQVAATAFDRVSGARWSKEAIAGNGRAQLTVYAYDDDGELMAGVDIIGDVTISGDLTIDGTLRPRKIDAALFAREGTSVWTGSMTPGLGQNLPVPFSLTLNPIQPQGRFFYELYIGLASNANTQQVSAHMGTQLYTNFVEDGGLFLRSYDDQGNVYRPKHGGSEGVRATTVFGTTFVANLIRGNLDTGIVADGDYYYRNVSATYTLTKLDLHVTWIAV